MCWILPLPVTEHLHLNSRRLSTLLKGTCGGRWWREGVCYSFTSPSWCGDLNWWSFDHESCQPVRFGLFPTDYAFKVVFLPCTCSTQCIVFLLCLSHSVGLRSKHVVTAFGSGSLNRCQLLEVSLSAWSALNIEITTLQPMNMELVQSSLFLNYWSVRIQ